MERGSPRRTSASRRPGGRSLAQKYSIFTGLLLSYVVFIFIAYDFWSGTFHPVKATSLALAALLIAGAISKFTNRLLARPLQYLHEAITAVRQGRLEPIQVSRTGDEIEFVGDSFNAMIENLAASRRALQEHQESLEDQVRQRTRDLEEVSEKALAASQAKSEFLANMSHELRTPMSGVLGMIDIALDSDLKADQRDQLITAKDCANTLLALLNDILDLSKIEAGKMEIEEVAFDISAVIRECVKSLRLRATEKGIQIRTSISSALPGRVAGDPLRFRQVVFNLLSNAVKFTKRGYVEVVLDVIPGDSGPRLVLEVRDTGSGIPPEKLSMIFEQFTQADGSISRHYGGTGLGLTITRKLLAMQGGEITVDSRLGEGSVFRVELPLKPVAVADQAGATAQVSEDEGASDSKSRPRILVVEDNPINQKVVAAMLRKHGYGVVSVAHGGEVLAALEREPVSLVLMDIQMPHVDGLEATRLIRNDGRWKGLPIVAMTALAMNGDRDRCLQGGMDGYMSKPVKRAQLIAVIEKHLAERPASQEQYLPQEARPEIALLG